MIINDITKLNISDANLNKLIKIILENENEYIKGKNDYSLGIFLANDDLSSYALCIDFVQLKSHCERYNITKNVEKIIANIINDDFDFTYYRKNIFNDSATTFLVLYHYGNEVIDLLESLLKANPIYNLTIIINNNINNNVSFFPNLKYYSNNCDNYINPVCQKVIYSKNKNTSFLNVNTHKELLEVFDDNRIKTISIVIPREFKDTFDKVIINKHYEEIEIEGFYTIPNTPVFISKINNKCKCLKYDDIFYEDLIKLERAIDIFNINETYINHNKENIIIFYTSERHNAISFNNVQFLNNVLKIRKAEEYKQKEMVNDVISVIPVRYKSKSKILKNCCIKNNFIVNNVLTGIKFQEYFECGSTSITNRTFAGRISRYDLGSIVIQPLEELHYNYFSKLETPPIGEPIVARLIIALDNDTEAAVLYICVLAINNLVTKYLDDISRNEVFIRVDKEIVDDILSSNSNICCKEDSNNYYINLSDYLFYKFKIEFVGDPRNLIIVPKDLDNLEYIFNTGPSALENIDNEDDENNVLEFNVLSSMLYCESYFDKEYELGNLIDNDLFYAKNSKFKNKWGWSLYNYAKTLMSKHALILASSTFKDYVVERIDFEVVTLYYFELILFESSAIQIATIDISEYIKSYRSQKKWYIKLKDSIVSSSSSVLRSIEHIQGEYAKTIDFWDVQMSYFTSKKMLEYIRLNFDIENDLHQLERTRCETENIYQSKKTNISNRNGLILTLMGLLLTISSIYEIFAGYVDDETSSSFEEYFFTHVSEALLIKIIAIIIIAIILIRTTTIKVFEKNKDK